MKSGLAFAVAVALAMSGCGESSAASLQLSISPNPVCLLAFSPGHGQVLQSAKWTTTIRETAGVGGALLHIDTTITDGPTGEVLATLTLDPASIAQVAGSARIEAHGSAAVPQTWGLEILRNGLDPGFDVRVYFRDDNGNSLTAEERVRPAAEGDSCA